MKTFFLSIGLLFFVGCSETKVPPPQSISELSQKKLVRSYKQMHAKLKTIRRPLKGENISIQKRFSKNEIDILLKDTKQYIQKVKQFEKHHRYRKKKKEKKAHLKSIQEVKRETGLKYY